MKMVIAADKFKGSLTASGVCRAIEAGIKSVDKRIETISLPMADGGDGFASVLQHYLHTETIKCTTLDPLQRPVNASYQWNRITRTAIIEMAVASGLVLLKEHERNPLLTSTYGTGLLIKDAAQKGAEKIILGIGGSATNDGGTGILEALGFVFKDENSNVLRANGQNLGRIKNIIPRAIPKLKFEIACDVQNVLYGPAGAAFVYGPQKGADKAQAELLDNGLKNLAAVLLKETGKDIATVAGTGAAGGIAASLLCYFNTELKQGIEMVMDASGIRDKIKKSALVITGEGKIDRQSLDGKVIAKIAALAHENKIPVIAFCGKLELTADEINETGLSGAYPISESISIQESMQRAGEFLTAKAKQVIENMLAGN